MDQHNLLNIVNDNDENTSDLVIDKQLCFAMYSATNAVIRAYRPILKALDLTYPQYLVMMVLWGNNGINVKALGHKLHLDSGTLTPLLKRLEQKNLLTRERSEKDERVREIFLTPSGSRIKSEAEDIPNAMLCKAKLPLDELLTMKESCERLLANLNAQ